MKVKYYAIVIAGSKEFYPDPPYTELERINKKIKYLKDYETENNMPTTRYIIETLTPARLEQQNREWKEWTSMQD